MLLFSGLFFFYDRLCYSITQVGKNKAEAVQWNLCCSGCGSGGSTTHGEVMAIKLEMPTPQKPWDCFLHKENPFFLSLTVFVGGQEQVCADGRTRVIDFSNTQLLQLHQPWCCVDCFPSCRCTWICSCPCSVTRGWLVDPSGSDGHLVCPPSLPSLAFWGD